MSEEKRPHPPLWGELRGHPAFQTAMVFGGASWLTLQAADIFGLETATVRAIGLVAIAIMLLLVGYALFVALRGQEHSAVTRGGARTVAAVTAILLVLGTGAWFARPHLVPPLRPGADVIAVLPFNASGAGVEVLGEGLVDLLSANLNEVSLIRTINPRTTLHEFSEHARNGSLDLEGQLRVGRNVGAGSVLVGSLVSTGTEVRINAELYSVETGTVIARAQQNGQPDSVLALVDELSIQLLKDIWRASTPIPELRLSAITTTSVPALGAYMRGEQFYRRVQWDSARAAFTKAVEHDSTFALAHYRLGETYGWSESLGSERALYHSGRAAQFADRLPEPVQQLIVAHQLHEAGDVEAIDRLTAYVNSYPDDIAGHYLLADARLHAGAVLGLNLEAMLAGFEQVHARDSTFAPNYAHLLELTISAGDSARYGRYLAGFAALLPEEAATYEIARDIRWGERDEALATLGSALRTEGSRRQQLLNRTMNAMSARGYAHRDVDVLLAAIDTLEKVVTDIPQVKRQASQSRVSVYGSAGRIREAEGVVSQLRSVNPDQALGAAMFLIVSGVAPESAFGPERELVEGAAEKPGVAYWLTLHALARGDTKNAERHLRTLEQDTSTAGFVRPEMKAALRGWLTAAGGDTVTAITQMRSALRDLGYSPTVLSPTVPLRVQLAVLQISRPESRPEGLRRLEYIYEQDPSMLAFIAVPLAEGYRSAGRVQEARLVYSRFIELWRNADAELQPRVRAAEDALGRMTADRGAT